MTASPLHPDLDLAGRIRPGLDILANEIVIGLKKRTRFPQNRAIYEPGLVVGDTTRSLLHYELGRIEACHAELGRYTFAVQDSFSDVSQVRPVIARQAPESPVQKMASGMGERIIAFYRAWTTKACAPGDLSDNYGETVTCDVATLLSIMERVSLGKSVAEAKFVQLTDQFMATDGDREAMLALIVRKDREAAVIDMVRALAARYELAEPLAIEAFEFMIATTIDIEVDYLRRRIASHGIRPPAVSG